VTAMAHLLEKSRSRPSFASADGFKRVRGDAVRAQAALFCASGGGQGTAEDRGAGCGGCRGAGGSGLGRAGCGALGRVVLTRDFGETRRLWSARPTEGSGRRRFAEREKMKWRGEGNSQPSVWIRVTSFDALQRPEKPPPNRPQTASRITPNPRPDHPMITPNRRQMSPKLVGEEAGIRLPKKPSNLAPCAVRVDYNIRYLFGMGRARKSEE
jgi:hypothetical protein